MGHAGYEVSDLGGLRNTVTGRRHNPKPNKRGYVMASFDNRKREQLHRVVLKAFRGPPPAGTEGSHLNGTASDNRLVNLEWETHSQNLRRIRDHGASNQGERVSTAKLTERDVREIRRRYAAGATGTALAKEFGVVHGTIYGAVGGRTWRCVQ